MSPEDGDPVDVFLMGQELLPMTLVRIRPIGMLRMQDEGSSDNKVLAVPVNDPRFEDVADLQAVATHHLRELEHFLSHYKDLERKQTVVTEWVGRTEAVREVRDGLRSYRTRRRANEPAAHRDAERFAS